MNVLDRILAVFAPRQALRRWQARQALGAGDQAMPLIHRLQDRPQEHCGYRVGIRDVAIDHLHPCPLGFVLKDQGEVAAAS